MRLALCRMNNSNCNKIPYLVQPKSGGWRGIFNFIAINFKPKTGRKYALLIFKQQQMFPKKGLSNSISRAGLF